MAAKAPIVAARVGGVSEAVSEEEAVLVPPEDPSALARAMEETLSAPDVALRRADRALDRLHSEYSLDVFVDRYEAIYGRILRA
jgi:glycosyltransferase involved in cell wall biosynthesis